jgi:hypothetical protein
LVRAHDLFFVWNTASSEAAPILFGVILSAWRHMTIH